jgi:hypothetical protein
LAEAGYAGEEIVYHVVEADPIQMAAANDLVALWMDAGVNVRVEAEPPASDRMFSWTAPLPYIYDTTYDVMKSAAYTTFTPDSSYAVFAPF